jgi:hypothetical protein
MEGVLKDIFSLWKHSTFNQVKMFKDVELYPEYFIDVTDIMPWSIISYIIFQQNLFSY